MQNFFGYKKYGNGDCVGGFFYSIDSDGTPENNNCREWCNNNSSCLSFGVWHGICFFKNIGCGNNVKLGGNVILYIKQGMSCHVFIEWKSNVT